VSPLSSICPLLLLSPLTNVSVFKCFERLRGFL
jgi:hypothetical protein